MNDQVLLLRILVPYPLWKPLDFQSPPVDSVREHSKQQKDAKQRRSEICVLSQGIIEA